MSQGKGDIETKSHYCDRQGQSTGDAPTFALGPIAIPLYAVPLLINVSLIAFARVMRIQAQSLEPQSTNQYKLEEINTDSAPDDSWEAPNVILELARMVTFFTPLAGFCCLIGFCCSCLPWWALVDGEPGMSPSIRLESPSSIIGGVAYFVLWAIDGFPKDRGRALRPPARTFWCETRYCLGLAGPLLFLLNVGWLFARITTALL